MGSFRLRTLFLLFALAAVVCAAAWSPTRWAANTASTIVIFVWGFAVLAATYRRGEARAQAVGFCMFSSVYGAILIGWPQILPATALFPKVVDGALLTGMTKQVRELDRLIKDPDFPKPQLLAFQRQREDFATKIAAAVARRTRTTLAHCTTVMAIAWIGAFFARWHYRRGATDVVCPSEAE